MGEKWLPVSGWEGRYEVSNHGRVRGVTRVLVFRDGRGRTQPGQLKRLDTDRYGRLRVSLFRDSKRTFASVHRLVVEAFVGPPPDGMECCHNDGDKTNNRVENLRWDTRSANMQDQLRHGVHHQAGKTHCHKGHPFSGDNLKVFPPGSAMRRRCRQCHRDRDREYKRASRRLLAQGAAA